MNTNHNEYIIQLVKEIGVYNTMKFIGGEKDIIRKVYIDNPESYLDNLKHKPLIHQNHNRTVFIIPTNDSRKYNMAWFDVGCNNIVINNTTNDYNFYKSIMNYDINQICRLIKDWLVKHYDGFVDIKNLKPIPYY